MRGIRNQLDVLVTGNEGDLRTMALGLAHSLSRYKLKFSPDKVDTMIVQAICMLCVKDFLHVVRLRLNAREGIVFLAGMMCMKE